MLEKDVWALGVAGFIRLLEWRVSLGHGWTWECWSKWCEQWMSWDTWMLEWMMWAVDLMGHEDVAVNGVSHRRDGIWGCWGEWHEPWVWWDMILGWMAWAVDVMECEDAGMNGVSLGHGWTWGCWGEWCEKQITSELVSKQTKNQHTQLLNNILQHFRLQHFQNKQCIIFG